MIGLLSGTNREPRQIAAIQQGLDLKIISDNVLTVAEFVWAVKPDSPIKSVKDLKGAKIGYTNPRSTSQGLSMLLLQKGGLAPNDAELVRTGGFGEGIAALDTGLITVAAMPEPLWSKFKDKYRPIAIASEILPWTVTSAVISVLAGLPLFTSRATHYVHNIAFQVKMVFLLLALINMLWFHLRTERSIADWDTSTSPITAARMAGLCSMVVWAGVLLSGRWIGHLI